MSRDKTIRSTALNWTIAVLIGIFFLTMLYSNPTITGSAIGINSSTIPIEFYQVTEGTVIFDKQLLPLGTYAEVRIEDQSYQKNIISFIEEDPTVISFDGAGIYGYDTPLTVGLSKFYIELPEGTHQATVSLIYDGQVLDQTSTEIVVVAPIIEESAPTTETSTEPLPQEQPLQPIELTNETEEAIIPDVIPTSSTETAPQGITQEQPVDIPLDEPLSARNETFEIEENVNTTTSTNFDSGTYDNTHFNTSMNSLILNSTASIGSYASQIFDAGQNATWRNITFVANATGGLPSNGVVEDGPDGFNMSGNVLLYHLNNDTAFGENNTRVVDFSGNGLNGTWNGSGSVTAEPYSGALGPYAGAFDSVDDDIFTDSNFPVMSAGTMSVWIYRTLDTGNNERIVGNDDEYEVIISNSDIISCQFYRASTVDSSGESTSLLNRWYHIVCVWNDSASTGSTYLDGYLDANYTDMDGTAPTAAVMYIGDSANDGAARDQNFPGRIDEVAFWNRTLSDEDVRKLYLRGVRRHNLSVRSCDDSACSGESYTDINESSPVTLSVSDQRYFQYNFTFETNVTGNTTGIYNVSIDYNISSASDAEPPTVSALVPTNNTSFNLSVTIEIAANVTDGGTIDAVMANITNSTGNTTLITLTQAGGTPIYNNTYTIPNNSTGVYNITIIANDTGGNANRNQTTQFNAVDQIPPAITNTGCTPSALTTGNSTICNATITDATTIQTVQANITLPNGTIESPTISNVTSNFYFNYSNTQINGTYTITWIANDTTVNLNDTRTSATFTLNDTYKPTVTALVPTNNTTYNISTTIEIAANITDNGTVNNVQANITQVNSSTILLTLTQAGGTKIYNNTYTIPNITGVYNVTIIANDTNANINNNQTTQFNAVDQTPPAIINTGCTPTSITTGNSTTCNATITDHTTIHTVQANITLPNGTIESPTITNSTSNFWINASNTQINGTYTVAWIANDTTSNLNNTRTSTTFTLNDTYKPTVAALVPTNNTSFNISTTIEIAANITDNGTINNAQANITQINSSTVLLTLTQAGGTRIYNTTYTIPNTTGVYNVTIIANDTNGNINNNQTSQINAIDQIPPPITNQGCTPTSLTTGNSTICNATITDQNALSAVMSNVTFPNGTVETQTVNNNTPNFWINFSNSRVNGTYTTTWTANDTSNNINNTQTGATFTVNDTFIPSVTALVPTNGTMVNMTYTIEIAANITDNGTISSVQANITQPNGTAVLLTLSGAAGTPIYNTTYSVPPITGNYNITLIANDTNGNTNRSEATLFISNAYCGMPINRTTTLVANLNSCAADGIVMNANHTVLDCNNYDIVGLGTNSTSTGIIVDNSINITIRNCNVTGFDRGLVINTTWNSSVFNSTFVSYNLDRGINLIRAKNNTFYNVTGRSNSSHGIDLARSGNNTFILVEGHSTSGIGIYAGSAEETGNLNEHNLFLNVTGNSSSSNGIDTGVGDNQTFVDCYANSTSSTAFRIGSTHTNMTRCTATAISGIGVAVNAGNHNYIQGSMIIHFASEALSLSGTNTTVVNTVVQLLGGVNQSAVRISGNNNTLTNLTTYVSNAGSTASGIYISGGDNTSIISSTINSDAIGIQIDSKSNRNFFNNTFINTSGSRGITVSNSINTTFNDVSVNLTGSGTVLLVDTYSNSTVIDGFLLTNNFNITVDNRSNLSGRNVTFFNGNGSINFPSFTVNQEQPFDTNGNLTITFNETFVNSSRLPQLNTTAKIILYNLSTNFNLSNISPMYDPEDDGTYVACPTTICTEDSYDSATGTYTFNVTGFTAYGGSQTDTIRPTVTALIPTNNTTYNLSTTITIGANVTDNIQVDTASANISQADGTTTLISLSQAGGTPIYNATYSIPNTTGTYNMTIVANDTSSNVNMNQTSQINVVDQIPPNISAQSCTPSSITTGNSTICNATITDHTGVILVQANVTLPNGTIDVQTISNNTNNFYFNFSNTQINGTYNVTWIANDTNGYFNNSRVITTFTLNDTYKPTVTALIPTNNTSFNVSTTITIAANVTDNGTVSVVMANITNATGNTTLITLSQAGGTRIYNNTYTIPNITGVYNVTIIANDTNANINNNQTTQFNAVDQTPPAIINTGCTPTSITTGNSTTCNATITDARTIQTVQANITLPNGTIESPTISNDTSNYYFNYTNTQINGTYTITWIANDTSGNLNNTRTSSIFTLNDTYKPTVAALVPTNNTSFNISTTITIAANVTDNGTVNNVQANITQVNSSTILLTLTQAGGTRIYNGSYLLGTAPGRYNVTIIANDTNGNINNNQTTEFIGVDEIAPAINLAIPDNNTNIINTSINFTWYVIENQDTNISCDLFLDGVANQTGFGIANNTNFSTIISGISTGRHNWSVQCSDNNPTTNTSGIREFVKILPSSSKFSNNSATTNFSAIANVENVTNLTLASDYGMIRYRNNLNASTADFDATVTIDPLFISVNTSNLISLDADYNGTADLTIHNVSCPVTTIVTRDGFFSTRADIQANGTDCEAIGKCTNIVCQDNTLNFTVTSFSGFTAEGTANLTIDNTGPHVAGSIVQFNASYINSTSGSAIPSANCTIRFEPDAGAPLSDLMLFNLSGDNRHRYNRTFGQHDIYHYNITCSAAGYTTINANDTVHITPIEEEERDGRDNIPKAPAQPGGGLGGGGGGGGGGKSEPKRTPQLPTPVSNPPLYDLDFPTPVGKELFQPEEPAEPVEEPREEAGKEKEEALAPEEPVLMKPMESQTAVHILTSIKNGITSIYERISAAGKAIATPNKKITLNIGLSSIIIFLCVSILIILTIRDIQRMRKMRQKKEPIFKQLKRKEEQQKIKKKQQTQEEEDIVDIEEE